MYTERINDIIICVSSSWMVHYLRVKINRSGCSRHSCYVVDTSSWAVDIWWVKDSMAKSSAVRKVDTERRHWRQLN